MPGAVPVVAPTVVQLWPVVPQAAMVNGVPLAVLAAGSVRQRFAAPVSMRVLFAPVCHVWVVSALLQVLRTTAVPAALASPTVSRHMPSTCRAPVLARV